MNKTYCKYHTYTHIYPQPLSQGEAMIQGQFFQQSKAGLNIVSFY